MIINLPELVGGSADLSGSNNTKTKHSVILKPANFNGNYIHYGVRETWYGGNYEWNGSSRRYNSIWWNFFNFFRLL